MWRTSGEILTQQVGRNIESVVAVDCDFVFVNFDNFYPISPASSALRTGLQILGYPTPPVAFKTNAVLFADADAGKDRHFILPSLAHRANPSDPETMGPGHLFVVLKLFKPNVQR